MMMFKFSRWSIHHWGHVWKKLVAKPRLFKVEVFFYIELHDFLQFFYIIHLSQSHHLDYKSSRLV